MSIALADLQTTAAPSTAATSGGGGGEDDDRDRAVTIGVGIAIGP